MKLPKFILYGQDDPNIEERIQPALALRRWSDLSQQEKSIALQQLKNKEWIGESSSEILNTIAYLNEEFLRECPGKNLHAIKPERNHYGTGNESKRNEAAFEDFQIIMVTGKSDAIVLRMLSKFASCHIDKNSYREASKATNEEDRKRLIDSAFKKFDRLEKCLNHIFEQFAVNQVVTRNGFVPRQDEKIVVEVYEPTLRVLSDPKWKTVSGDLAGMFEDYRERNYPEAITKAHAAVQRFLQILTGEEGRNAKGEVGKLFREAKSAGLIPTSRFIEPLINHIQGFIESERATNSTAKPALKDTTPSDALLVMNVVMVFLQYCLQNSE